MGKDPGEICGGSMVTRGLSSNRRLKATTTGGQKTVFVNEDEREIIKKDYVLKTGL